MLVVGVNMFYVPRSYMINVSIALTLCLFSLTLLLYEQDGITIISTSIFVAMAVLLLYDEFRYIIKSKGE